MIVPAEEFARLAPQWILNSPEWFYNLSYDFFKSFILEDRYLLIIEGFKNTLILTFFSLIIGVLLGVIVSLIRVSYDRNFDEMVGAPRLLLKIANTISKIYLTVIRGTPVMVQILIMFFVIMASSSNKVLVGIITFGINSGAYVAEIIRGGIMSIDIGQTEAGRSQGFSYTQTMRYIVLPQAFKNVLPSLGNEFIVLIKETSVVGYIGLMDLTYAASTIGGNSYEYFFPLISVALIYLTLVMIFSYFVGRIERRSRDNDR